MDNMPRYVALLRGINVGGHRVKMDRLRALFEELGCENVQTFIASGNVMFSTESTNAEELEREIEGHLAERLGYDVATFLRSPTELSAVAAFRPGTEEEDGPESSVYVIFLKAPTDDDLEATFSQLTTATDEFVFSGREIYWLLQGKLSESALFAGDLTKATRGIHNTMRNMTTLRRLVAKLDASL